MDNILLRVDVNSFMSEISCFTDEEAMWVACWNVRKKVKSNHIPSLFLWRPPPPPFLLHSLWAVFLRWNMWNVSDMKHSRRWIDYKVAHDGRCRCSLRFVSTLATVGLHRARTLLPPDLVCVERPTTLFGHKLLPHLLQMVPGHTWTMPKHGMVAFTPIQSTGFWTQECSDWIRPKSTEVV